jgi:hypothetical protein
VDINKTVASVKIAAWEISVIECIDTHNGEVMDREFVCTKGDMSEPQASLVEAVEFVQSVTGHKALNPWSYVEMLAKQADKFHSTLS